MDSGRAVLLRYTRNGQGRRGSGLRIGEHLVLTADHCADGDNHRVIVDGQEYPAELVVRTGATTVDIAILSAPTMPTLPRLSCARVNTGVAATLSNCQVLGYPRWKDRRAGATRAQVDGYVPTGEGADPHAKPGAVPLLAFKVSSAAPRDLPVPQGDLDQAGSQWAGMSGSVLVTNNPADPNDSTVIGVICSHSPCEGAGSLSFTPLGAIDTLPSETAAKFWSLLNVQDPHALPVLPQPEISGADSRTIVVGQLPAEPPAFVERAAVDRLRTADASGADVLVLTGMRGAGKSHAAAAYARSRIHDGPGLVGWVNAASVDTAITDLARIAEALGVADPEGDSLESARRLREHLASWRGESLLVFDNATNPGGLSSLLPTFGHTQIIITTTDIAFEEFGTVIDVAAFTESEAIDYLRLRTGIDDAAGAGLLAAELGGLPLALAAAATTIRRHRYRDYVRYLDELRRYPVSDVLHAPSAGAYQLPSAAAILLSIDLVERDDPDHLAGKLIGALAVLSPEGIRVDLLSTLYGRDDAGARAAGEAIDRCQRGSLLSWSTVGHSVMMHRLMRRVVRERADSTGSRHVLVEHALTLLEPHLFDRSRAWSNRELGQHLVQQIEAVWSTGLETMPRHILMAAVRARSWSVQQLEAAADLTRAIDIGERTLADCERLLGVQDPHTLTARNDLALAYQSAGRLRAAIQMFERTLAERERILGTDHCDTLASRNNLAAAYREEGRLEPAIQLYQRSLDDIEHVFGRDHAGALTARNNLAAAYQEAGRVHDAIRLFERNFADIERTMGFDHPNTLTARNNLALAYLSAGRIPDAAAIFERNLADRERVLGSDHPDTLKARNNLASAQQSAGRTREATELFEQTLADTLRLLGPNHPDTLTVGHNLASAYQAAGRAPEAIAQFVRNLGDHERALGAHHPDTLRVAQNLGWAYLSAGRTDEAIAQFERNLADRERALGPRHLRHPGRPRRPCFGKSIGRAHRRSHRPVRAQPRRPRARAGPCAPHCAHLAQ